MRREPPDFLHSLAFVFLDPTDPNPMGTQPQDPYGEPNGDLFSGYRVGESARMKPVGLDWKKDC